MAGVAGRDAPTAPPRGRRRCARDDEPLAHEDQVGVREVVRRRECSDGDAVATGDRRQRVALAHLVADARVGRRNAVAGVRGESRPTSTAAIDSTMDAPTTPWTRAVRARGMRPPPPARRAVYRRLARVERPERQVSRGQRPRRRASARRSASSRSSSDSRWSTKRIVSAIARWPACSAMRRCISCPTRRYAGGPAGRCAARASASPPVRSSAWRSGCGTPSRRRRAPAAGTARQGAVRFAERSIAASNSAVWPASSISAGRSYPWRGREWLPFDGEHAVALQVTERAVVGKDVEPVVDSLERAAGLVPPVRPLTDVGPKQGHALVGRAVAEPSTGAGDRADLSAGTASPRGACPRHRDRSR